MIKVALAPEPPTFEELVRRPGLRALAEMVGESPVPRRPTGRAFKKIAARRSEIPPKGFPPYWTHALEDLMEAYHCVCAYSCFRIHPVTGGRSVDHMAPRSLAWDLVYEWTNYRLACSRINSRKRDYLDVLDPFDVEDGWFVLELVGFQVRPAPHLPEEIRDQVQTTIDRLMLNDFRRDRERDAENYWAGLISFEILQEESPFVAKELRRQERLREGDARRTSFRRPSAAGSLPHTADDPCRERL